MKKHARHLMTIGTVENLVEPLNLDHEPLWYALIVVVHEVRSEKRGPREDWLVDLQINSQDVEEQIGGVNKYRVECWVQEYG